MILELPIRDFVKLLTRYEFVEVECHSYATVFTGRSLFKLIDKPSIDKMLGKSRRSITASLTNFFRGHVTIHLYNMSKGLALGDAMRIRDYEIINYKIIFEYDHGP